MLFSVIIPTKDRPASLERCLLALRAQDFPREEFEVIIIDDGGSKSLESTLENHRHHLALQLLTQENQGPASARNNGLKRATGQFILFTDDDCRPKSDWLKQMRSAFESDPNAACGGAILPAPENGIFGNASQLLVSFLYDYSAASPTFFCSNNLAFPREALLALGGFDGSIPIAAAEDRDICSRWSEHHTFRFVPDAIVVHNQMLDFARFWRQHYYYGRGAFHFKVRLISRGKQGVRVQPLSFYLRMLSYPWNKCSAPIALAHSSLLFLSQCANIAGFMSEKFRAR